MPALRIIAVAILAAIVYGICMDNVTARICVEYFTLGHPHVIDSESPTALAFTWGILATWWVGLLLGVPLALCARAGSRPRLLAGDLVRPMIGLMCCIGVAATISGVIGYVLAATDHLHLTGDWADYIPADKHRAFLADSAAHLAAYAAGFAGGVILCIHTFRVRKRRHPAVVLANLP